MPVANPNNVAIKTSSPKATYLLSVVFSYINDCSSQLSKDNNPHSASIMRKRMKVCLIVKSITIEDFFFFFFKIINFYTGVL